jgi:hypothetical protein
MRRAIWAFVAALVVFGSHFWWLAHGPGMAYGGTREGARLASSQALCAAGVASLFATLCFWSLAPWFLGRPGGLPRFLAIPLITFLPFLILFLPSFATKASRPLLMPAWIGCAAGVIGALAGLTVGLILFSVFRAIWRWLRGFEEGSDLSPHLRP